MTGKKVIERRTESEKEKGRNRRETGREKMRGRRKERKRKERGSVKRRCTHTCIHEEVEGVR